MTTIHREGHTDAQVAAIEEIERNLQIIACAGSGKTCVVSHRIMHILRTIPEIAPENIVAFTFTEKAAAELKDRISKLYRGEYANIEGLGAMYIGTIHGFCFDLLQQYVPDYLKFDVLDEVGQRLFIDRRSVQSGMKGLGLRRYLQTRLYARILGVMRETTLKLDIVAGLPVDTALRTYRTLLSQQAYLDFDEILVRAVEQVETNPDLRIRLAERVRYLTVDEYQDVNPIQERLVRELVDLGANVCVVGDDDQNIYQWRGSDVSHIIKFGDTYDDVVKAPLEENFRSSRAVIEAAGRIVERNENRIPKEMKSGNSDRVYERGDLLALSFADPDQEAAWIADKITRLRGTAYSDGGSERGLAWSDMAILLRSVKNTAQPIVDALTARGIEYVVTGMSGLFGTPEARAATAIFERLAGDIDDGELRRAWEEAGVGLTARDLDAGVALVADRKRTDDGRRSSLYYLQRVFLDYLAAIRLREDRVLDGRGELVYYNLGKFSQLISDYEAIHFKTDPDSKYRSFVDFLTYQAPDVYPEGGQDAAYAIPDAVQIMTVHQSKGREFPVVFLPCLQRNRFPSRRQSNQVWNYLPKAAVPNADRYDSSENDERRLMYVAITRAEKWLFCSWAPDLNNRLYKRSGLFFDELTHDANFLTRELPDTVVAKCEPKPRRPMINVEISFSDLKFFLRCPYEFKLRLLYGFNPPIHEALGYGRSLHNALAELHKRALEGEKFSEEDASEFVDRHLSVRYAYASLEQDLRRAAEKAFANYLRENAPHLDRLEHAEVDVELTLEDGIVVHGRIDLVRRTDTGETSVVDFKSSERAQTDEVTRVQLHLYALGYRERFGKIADLIEVHNLDRGGSVREVVDDALMAQTVDTVRDAGDRLRTNRFERLEIYGEKTCGTCDMRGICRDSE